MAEAVIMPKLGFNMSEGQVVKWHKQEGETVAKGDTLFEIMTDKTSIEIEATVSGVLRQVFVGEGEKVPVTVTVAIIGSVEEDISGLVQIANEQLGRDKAAFPESKEAVAASMKLTPRALRLAAEKGLDVSTLNLKGTGYQGGITERDLLRYLESRKEPKVTPVARNLAQVAGVDLKQVQGSGTQEKIRKADVERLLDTRTPKRTSAEDSPMSNQNVKEILKSIPYTGMRKVIGDRLSESKFTAPHVYFTTSVDVSALQGLWQEIKENTDVKISLNSMLLAAIGRTLEKHFLLNASLINGEIVLYRSINLGVAVAVDGGLIVPVIKNVQAKKLTDIASASNELIAKARNNQLLPDDYSGGTFTVSNLGMYGIEQFTAIINPPEAAILAVSAIKKTPVVSTEDGEDKIVVRPLLKFTLSVDHRIIDGAVAAQFLNDLKELLQNPIKILI